MQALAFDFDGLILDTETPELQVWQQEFQKYGVEMPEGYWTTVIGRGAEQEIERPAQLLHRLSPSFVESEDLNSQRRARIHDLIDRETVRPGIESLIREAQYNKVPIGIASSSKHAWVDRYLHKLNLFREFDAVVCADDVSRAKPFPDLYLELCGRLHVDPTQTVALEDSPNGVAAAKAAGLFTVAVPNPVTIELNLDRADLIVLDLSAWTLIQLDEVFLNLYS